jgi:O-antigen/teichoic acid export membrane protein
MPNNTPTDESQQERLNRNFNELLQELRVAQAGVQILFAFLLTVAFTPVFEKASGFVHGLHLVTVLFAAGAAALLTAPAAWHRVLFRQGRRVEIVHAANNFSLIGLGLLGTAMVGTVFLVAVVIVAGWLAVTIAVAAAALFGLLWFVWPSRLRSGEASELTHEITK